MSPSQTGAINLRNLKFQLEPALDEQKQEPEQGNPFRIYPT